MTGRNAGGLDWTPEYDHDLLRSHGSPHRIAALWDPGRAAPQGYWDPGKDEPGTADCSGGWRGRQVFFKVVHI